MNIAQGTTRQFPTSWEATSRHAVLPSMRVHYHDVGEGPALLMLHGGGPGANAWNNFRLSIPRLAPHFRLLMVDQPGFGGTDKPEHDRPQHEVACQVLRELIQHLGLKSVIPVANSMGGATALQLALESPGLVSKLILMAPGGGSLPVLSLQSRELGILASYYADPGPSPERMRAVVDALAYDGSVMPAEMVTERYEGSKDLEAARYSARMFAGLRRGQAPRQWTRLHEISQPTLLLWGREDRVIPLDASFHMLRQINDARLHVFRHCGHWPHIEARVEFEDQVLAFAAERGVRDD